MEFSHAISDAFLALTGIFVFFQYLRKLEFNTCLLWEAFILSVTAAAIFGTLRFMGINQAHSISDFFQQLAGTVGAISLVVASLYLVMRKNIERNTAYLVLLIGFILFALVRWTNNENILKYISLTAIPLVFIIGIFALIKKRSAVGGWLILGVIAIIMATYNKQFMANTILDPTDVYHYLVAISIFCFARAARHHIA